MPDTRALTDVRGFLERFATVSGFGVAGEGPFLGGRVVWVCPRQQGHRDGCALASPGRSCPVQRRGRPQQEFREIGDSPASRLRLTVCGARSWHTDRLTAWADLAQSGLEAILRREEELDLTARELALTYDELWLVYELCAMLQDFDREAEMAEAALEQLSLAVPSDASVLLCSDAARDFPRLVAARAREDRDIALTTTAAHWVEREGLLAEASRGILVSTADLGAEDLEGELLVASAGKAGQTRDLLVIARWDATRGFSTGEVKLVCAAARQVALALSGARLREGLVDLFLGTIRALAAAVDAKDPYTRGHSQRVAALAVGVGRQIGLTKDEIEQLQLAALLHDVGKIAVSTEVLTKPSALDGNEWSMIKSHPARGAEILVCVSQLAGIIPAVRYHHERLDGSGYPEGLKGEEIPLLARIVGVCDAYDAMTSARPYRGAMLPQAALSELRAVAGKTFDHRVVEALAKVVQTDPLS
ncbi:MAG: HD-GYP domain-containing protein [Armatimonadetes bacterium]|nr:HD-GYP domain-containing protein [Armatimonadota bacterium]